LIHANPRSEPGRIALYAQGVVAVEKAQVAVDTAAAALDSSLAGFKVSYPAYPDYSLDTLQMRADYLMALPMPTAAETAELAALQTVLASQQAMDLMNAEEQLASAQADADAALALAANKPVNDAVKAWVDAQLEAGGVLDYYRAQ
jgi:hypothetical protein